MDRKDGPLLPVQNLELRFYRVCLGHIAQVAVLGEVRVVYRPGQVRLQAHLSLPVQEQQRRSPGVIGQDAAASRLHHPGW